MANINKFFDRFTKDPKNEQGILTAAAMDLNGKELAVLKDKIEREKKKGEDSKDQASGSVAGTGSFIKIEGNDSEENSEIEISQKAVDDFWNELEKLDPITLVSDDVLDAFKYIGFDPETVLREILKRGMKAGKKINEIKKDMVDMVTIAIIKGSITDRNLQKTSDSGKLMYKKLTDTYQLISNGTKGKDSTYLTVARVAAAVPGMVIQILVKKPAYAKTFVGPFGSKSLPPYLRHQAAAACIPEHYPEKLKDFVLGLITAYTADQSKTLSRSKDTAEELFDNQLNFVTTTHGSKHPSEDQRKKIFGSFSLSSDYEKLHAVALRVKKIKPDYTVLTQNELDSLLSSL